MVCTQIIKSGPNQGHICGRSNCSYHKAKVAKKPVVSCVAPIMKKIIKPDGMIDLVIKLPNAGNTEADKAAHDIIQIFKTGIRFIVLVAETQSGKTGACKMTIVQFCKEYDIVIPFVIIPVNDNEILNQARREFDKIVDATHILSIPQLKNANHIRQLMEHDRITCPNAKFLIIIDESHMGATIDNNSGTTCLLNNLRNINIRPNGLSAPDNCNILTVSATPNAEISGMIHTSINGKKQMVKLKPGKTYYGVKDMFELNRVHQSLDLSEVENQKALAELLKSKYANLRKYAIVRALNSHHSSDMMTIFHNYSIPCIPYDMYNNKGSKIQSILNRVPEQLTVIFIIQRCRASMQIDSTNVCMIHESYNADAPTTAQALPGRMCGYNKRDHAVDIYCNVDALKVHLNWINSDFNCDAIPVCKNITGGVSETVKHCDNWTYNKPILGILDQQQINTFNSLMANNKGQKLYGRLEIQAIVKQLLNNSSMIPIKGNGLMILTADNAENSKFKFWHGINPHKKIHGFEVSSIDTDLKRIQFANKYGYYMYINMIAGDSDFGKYRIFYTNYIPYRVHPSEPKECSIYHHKH